MSTSDSRQRSPVTVQLSPDERAKIAADAQAVGLSLGGYFRFLGMRMQTPRTQPAAPLPERQDLARLLAALGKVGGNLNQLTKLANQGQIVPPSALAACLDEVRAAAEQVRETLR